MMNMDREQSISILCIDALSDRDYYQNIKSLLVASNNGINIQIEDNHVDDNHERILELNKQAARSALNRIKSQDNPPDIAILLLSPKYYDTCTTFHAQIIKRYKEREIIVLGIAIAARGFEETDPIRILCEDHPLAEKEHTDASYQEIVSKVNAVIELVRTRGKAAFWASITEEQKRGDPLIRPPESVEPPRQDRWPHGLMHAVGTAYERAPAIYRYMSIVVLALLVGGLFGYQLHPQASGPGVFATPSSPTAVAHTLLVTNGQDSGPGTLRDQVEKAQDGDVISFAPSVKNVVLESSLTIKKDIAVWGDRYRAPALLDRNVEMRRDKEVHPVTIESSTESATIGILPGLYVTLSNLTFQGDNVPLISAFITISAEDQTAGSGALLLIDCDVSQFASNYNGSFIGNIGGNVEIRDSYFSNNSSQGDGGGVIYNLRGMLTVDHSTLTQNSTDYSGGAIYNINGEVSVINNSWLTSNLVNGDNIDAGGGGGAINSSNGSLLISNSWLSDNTSFADGGALLLNGTTAQIINSYLNNNKASGNKGGAIAVESNPDNNVHSILSLFATEVRNNRVAGNDQSSPEANIGGQSVSSADQQIVRTSGDVTKDSDYNLSSNHEKLATLTVQDFSNYCATLDQKFTDASVGVNTDTIKCLSNDSTQNETLSQLHKTVRDVCVATVQAQLRLGEDSKQIIDRLASYWDPLSWQCFKNEKPLGTITEGIVARQSNLKSGVPQTEVPLDRYCQQKFGKGTYAYLLPHDQKNKATAYDIKCKDPSNKFFRISMAEACFKVYNNDGAIYRLVDFTNPNSWECWGPKNS